MTESHESMGKHLEARVSETIAESRSEKLTLGFHASGGYFDEADLTEKYLKRCEDAL